MPPLLPLVRVTSSIFYKQRGNAWSEKEVTTMLKDKEVQDVILHTLAELRRTIKASEKENYTKGELLDLLKKVADFMIQRPPQ